MKSNIHAKTLTINNMCNKQSAMPCQAAA